MRPMPSRSPETWTSTSADRGEAGGGGGDRLGAEGIGDQHRLGGIDERGSRVAGDIGGVPAVPAHHGVAPDLPRADGDPVEAEPLLDGEEPEGAGPLAPRAGEGPDDTLLGGAAAPAPDPEEHGPAIGAPRRRLDGGAVPVP